MFRPLVAAVALSCASAAAQSGAVSERADQNLVRATGVSPPAPIERVDPDYSELAKAARYEGTAVVAIVVDENGVPKNVRVVKALGMGLDEKAIESVKQWRFKPGMKDGQPVNVAATVQVRFQVIDKGWRTRNLSFVVPSGSSLPTIDKVQIPEFPTALPATVSLAFDLDRKGKPRDVHVVQTSNVDLDDSAVASVRKWRFHPAVKDGQAIPASGTVDLTFQP